MTPKISIITINYNNCLGLRKTLQSVSSQTYKDYEYIVVDGASTDGSQEEMAQFKDIITHPISEKDSGIYNAMNKGIALAKGEYCLFLNSGDYLGDEKVLQMVAPFLDGAHFVSGNTVCVPSPIENSQQAKRHQLTRLWCSPRKLTVYYMLTAALSHQSTFIKTSLLKDRPYREDLRIASDWEQMLYEIILKDASYKSIPVTVSVFSMDGISSTNLELSNKERSQVLSEYFSKRVLKALLGPNELSKSVIWIGEGTQLYRWTLMAIRSVRKIYTIFH